MKKKTIYKLDNLSNEYSCYRAFCKESTKIGAWNHVLKDRCKSLEIAIRNQFMHNRPVLLALFLFIIYHKRLIVDIFKSYQPFLLLNMIVMIAKSTQPDEMSLSLFSNNSPLQDSPLYKGLLATSVNNIFWKTDACDQKLWMMLVMHKIPLFKHIIEQAHEHLVFIAFNHLYRMFFPVLIKWASPFPILVLLGGVFHFYSNFKRNFCKETVENLIRGIVFVYCCSHCL